MFTSLFKEATPPYEPQQFVCNGGVHKTEKSFV